MTPDTSADPEVIAAAIDDTAHVNKIKQIIETYQLGKYTATTRLDEQAEDIQAEIIGAGPEGEAPSIKYILAVLRAMSVPSIPAPLLQDSTGHGDYVLKSEVSPADVGTHQLSDRRGVLTLTQDRTISYVPVNTRSQAAQFNLSDVAKIKMVGNEYIRFYLKIGKNHTYSLQNTHGQVTSQHPAAKEDNRLWAETLPKYFDQPLIEHVSSSQYYRKVAIITITIMVTAFVVIMWFALS